MRGTNFETFIPVTQGVIEDATELHYGKGAGSSVLELFPIKRLKVHFDHHFTPIIQWLSMQ